MEKSPSPSINENHTTSNLGNLESSSDLLVHNGYHSNRKPSDLGHDHLSADIELISVKSMTYTSLKDILPVSPLSSSPTHNASWNQIPIKNPLVKQAALAYLQPMSSLPAVGPDKGLFQRFRDCICFRECGCLGWFHHVIFKSFREAFSERRSEIDDYDYDDDDYYYADECKG